MSTAAVWPLFLAFVLVVGPFVALRAFHDKLRSERERDS